jgi:hypothetical protein
MTKSKIMEIIKEIEEKYEIRFTDYREEKRGSKVVSVYYTVIFKVDE